MDNKNNEQKKAPAKKAFNKKKKYYKPKPKSVKVTDIKEAKSDFDETVMTKKHTSVNVVEESKQEASVDLTSDVKSEMIEKATEEKVVDLTFQSETSQVEEEKHEESKTITEKLVILTPSEELPTGVYKVDIKEPKKVGFFTKLKNKISKWLM